MKRITIDLISFLVCFSIITPCFSSTNNFIISLEDNNKIKINNKDCYKFNFSINGYEINCLGTKIILWGYPLKFNDGSPADNSYALVDLKDKRIIKDDLVSHGIFGAVFFNDGISAFLETGEGYIIDISKGFTKEIDNSTLDNLEHFSEKCKKPATWSFNKFPH